MMLDMATVICYGKIGSTGTFEICCTCAGKQGRGVRILPLPVKV